MSDRRLYYKRMPDNNSPPPEALELCSELQPLSDQVFAAIESGIEIARDFFGTKKGRVIDPWLFSHLVRFGALEHLPGAIALDEDEADVKLKRNPMCGIELTRGTRVMRIWKRPNGDNGVFLQPPGESPTRQQFYTQPQHLFPGSEHLFASHLVYVWDLSGAAFDLYLVKPIGFEAKWKPGEQEWWIRLEHPAKRLAPKTAFTELDDVDLPINLPETGSGDDDPDEGA